jgi:hypothetical protein
MPVTPEIRAYVPSCACVGGCGCVRVRGRAWAGVRVRGGVRGGVRAWAWAWGAWGAVGPLSAPCGVLGVLSAPCGGAVLGVLGVLGVRWGVIRAAKSASEQGKCVLP